MARACNNSISIISGFALGGILGGLATLLLAPKKGEDLRKELKCDLEDYIEGLAEVFKRDLKETKSVTERMVDSAEKIVELSKQISNEDDIQKISRVSEEISILQESLDNYNASFSN